MGLKYFVRNNLENQTQKNEKKKQQMVKFRDMRTLLVYDIN